MADITAVIPARYGATRFPGKALAVIQDKPMLHWVVAGVSQAKLIKNIIVATDDQRISNACEGLDVEVVMTDPDLASGSDRVFAACRGRDVDMVLNIQGDEPLITGELVDQMAQAMLDSEAWDVFTLGRRMNQESLESPNTAKIVCDQNGKALYFSRHPIPYSRVKTQDSYEACLKHIGIYGYRMSFLEKFCSAPPCQMELMEGLEQLRALYLGGTIQVLKVDYESWGVDTPEDIAIVEKQLLKRIKKHG